MIRPAPHAPLPSIAFLLIPVFVTAWQPTAKASDSTAYPLEQILAIAQHNATELKIIVTASQVQQKNADIDKSEAMPSVHFTGGYSLGSVSQGSEKLHQLMTLAALYDKNDFFNPVSYDEFSYPGRLNGHLFNWSMDLRQPLVTFGKVSSALKLARMHDCSARDSVRLKSDLFYLRVMREFAAAYCAQYDVSVNKASVNRARQMLIRTSSDYEAGRAIKRDLHRIEALVQREQAALIAARGLENTTKRRLAATINFGDSTAIVALKIDPDGMLSSPPPPSGPGNITIALKKNEAAMYKEQYRYIRSGYYPTLSLTGNITNQFMSVDTNGLLKSFLPRDPAYTSVQSLAAAIDKYNPGPANLFSPSFFDFAVGLQLSWTLFDGFRTRAQSQQAKKRLEQSLLELEIMKKEDHIALLEAKNQITTIDSMYTAVQLQIDAAREAFNQTEQDYRDGFTDFTTLLDTDREHRDAVRQLNDLKIRRILAYAQLRITLGLPVYGEIE